MKIDANLAVIKTAQVEIKALTVGGKQVTLAVFRQLDQKVIIDYETQKLNGVAWGRFNYHPDKCGDSSEHLHIVWQQGNQLFRDSIKKTFSRGMFLTLDEKFNSLQRLADTLCIVRDFVNNRFFRNASFREFDFEDVHTINKFTSYNNNRSNTEGILSQSYEEILSFLIEREKTFLEIAEDYDESFSIFLNFHNSTYEQFQNLDLLFIAV